MGWATDLYCNISFNRKTYNSLYEVEEDIKETEYIIQMIKDKIKAYALMTEPNKLVTWDNEKYDNLLIQIEDEVSQLLKEIEEYYFDLVKLNYLRDNWEYCHNKEGLAIPPPKEFSWNTAYLDGDFVKTVDNPNVNDKIF